VNNSRLLDPFVTCPVYETDLFKVRRVELEDAEDLLDCYADPASAPIFNSDNCHSDFRMETVDDMRSCIRDWLREYQGRGYVRFSIVDKGTERAVGTIEFFTVAAKYEDMRSTGILRLDIASRYEQVEPLSGLFRMVEESFAEGFDFANILTKAVPQAVHRISALRSLGYQPAENKEFLPYDDYYFK
jgi:hypothetical protein